MTYWERRLHRRSSGILLPVFSLPSDLDQGDFGPSAISWLDWLVAAGQSYWMLLPLNPRDATGSPYASPSAFAYDPFLVSPERLAEQGLLNTEDLRPLRRPGLNRHRALSLRWRLYEQALATWIATANDQERQRFDQFIRRSDFWLDPYVTFCAIKAEQQERPWWEWTGRAARRRSRPTGVRTKGRMQLDRFLQWQADQQWQHIRRAAAQRHIQLIGDVPFVVRHDSVDVWNNPQLFHLHRRRLTEVSGMPPDAFARQGQKWGTPVYRWAAHRRTQFRWWRDRIRVQLDRFDILRLDHFQGFIREWSIPVRRLATEGRWVPSAGPELFRALRRDAAHMPFIAEDLGLSVPAADALRRRYGIPGIRIFEFGWSGYPRNIHALHHVSVDMIYMTSNHDLPTISTWWRRVAKSYERRHFMPHVHGHSPVQTAIDLVMKSPACLSVLPMGDVLHLGAAARINHPGTKRGNWRWRLTKSQIRPSTAAALRSTTKKSGRLPRP